MDESTDRKQLSPQLMFMVRVKLPNPAGYHSSPSGDTEYESARSEAIFAVKPAGFEVKWPRGGERWPVDSEGYTFVPLVLTDHRDALANAIRERGEELKRMSLIKEGFDRIKHLL